MFWKMIGECVLCFFFLEVDDWVCFEQRCVCFHFWERFLTAHVMDGRILFG